jgi:NAD(P)-dependent dehydrogenase (short-subunit alcohol dehydrogenase family)
MPASLPHRLAGKKAFVTGAARGLGEAIARMLARHGAKVFLTDIDEPTVHAVAASLEAEHGVGTAFAAVQDVRNESRWAEVLAQAVRAMDGLSILVNNAGIGKQGRVEEVSLEDWHTMMAVNVDSVFLGCKHALPYLRDNQPASIVNISSIAGIVADGQYAAYNTSKAAVMMLTKSVALDCARAGVDVRCNSVHPGFIRTAIIEKVFEKYGEAEATRKLTKSIPMKRLGQPDDVANAVLYLASDESRFTTASELKVDGGTAAA